MLIKKDVVLFVEDNVQTRGNLLESARAINPDLEYLSTGSVTKALEISKRNRVKAFFVDIQLEDGNGLDLVQFLREEIEYQFTPIVFITAVPTKKMDAYIKLHCYDYIIKPWSQQELNKVLKKILINYFIKESTSSKDKIWLDFRGIKQSVYTREIVYVEYYLRRITIHLQNDVIVYKQLPLKTFAKSLPSNFIQVHQGYIVNTERIKKIDYGRNYIVLENNMGEIKIGTKFRDKIKDFDNAGI